MFGMLSGGALLMLIISFKFGELLKVMSAVLFFTCAVILMAGYEVAYSTETSGTSQCPVNDPCITHHYLIRQDDVSGTTSGSWAAWLFIILGILASIMFIIEMFHP